MDGTARDPAKAPASNDRPEVTEMVRARCAGIGISAVAAILLLASVEGRAAVPDRIKAGFLFGLTGAASPVGPVQLDGAKLAVKNANAEGGIRLGGKKVPVEFVVRDDETRPDVAIRRFRELVSEQKVDLIVGQTFAPISAALNKEAKSTHVPYFPVNVVALRMFEKSEMGHGTFAVHGSAYAAGYAGAAYIVRKLRFRKIVFFGPAYAFGQDQWAGARDAATKYGASMTYLESPVGTSDFTPYLTRVSELKPEIVMLAHWGVDAINVLKQANEVGLKKRTKIWFNWMTNVFGSGVPPSALEGVYSLMSWYYDMDGFKDAKVVKAAKEFTRMFREEYGYPPDPYSAMAYLGTKEALRGIELAQSTDAAAVAAAIMKSPAFDSMKGPGRWRADHQPLFKYGAFVVKGKPEKERRDPKWDLVRIVGVYSGEDYLPALSGLGY